MISIGTNTPALPQSSYQNTVNVNMPSATPAAPGKAGPSVEVSISPQANAMLTIDTQSLAAKGYSSVNIDTDGQPGAEITIDLTSGNAPGMVAIGTPGAGQLPGAEQGDSLETLLALLEKATGEKDAEQDLKLDSLLELLQSLLESTGILPPETSDVPAEDAVISPQPEPSASPSEFVAGPTEPASSSPFVASPGA